MLIVVAIEPHLTLIFGYATPPRDASFRDPVFKPYNFPLVILVVLKFASCMDISFNRLMQITNLIAVCSFLAKVEDALGFCRRRFGRAFLGR